VKILLRVGVGGIWWDMLPFFADENCAEQAYMAENWFLDLWFGDPVLISVLPGIHHARVPYMPQPGGEPGDPGVIRVGTPSGCDVFEGAPPLPLIPVDPMMHPVEPAPWDLTGDWPAPYHLDD
jgi:hypothetical protein